MRSRRRAPEACLGVRLMASDLLLSFMWVWSGAVLKHSACAMVRTGDPVAPLITGSISVVCLYCFALLGEATGGGSYNPLVVLRRALVGSFQEFLYSMFARIPSQVIGSVIGAWLINATFPAAVPGSTLKVDAHHGALTEGCLALVTVIVSLTIKKFPASYSTRTWMTSISKVILHSLASDTTGGIVNPASAFAWAQARGEHLTRERLCVYCLAPVEGTLLGVWASSLLLVVPQKHVQLHLIQKYKLD